MRPSVPPRWHWFRPLSRKGFEKVQEIMEGGEVLKTSEGNNPLFGKDLYYISILGTPSEKDPWMLQFGGHHLALNITIAHAAKIIIVDGETFDVLHKASHTTLPSFTCLNQARHS